MFLAASSNQRMAKEIYFTSDFLQISNYFYGFSQHFTYYMYAVSNIMQLLNVREKGASYLIHKSYVNDMEQMLVLAPLNHGEH